jgi:hypothetical protein
LAKWSQGFVDRDGKFVREFQTTFNSSFWELYLHAGFKELGFTIDFSKPAPDFYLQSDDGEFLAEAVTANHPDGFRPEWDWNATPPEDFDEFLRLATVRIANAITEKHKKYITSYANLSHVKGKPFVLCVAPFEQPGFFFQGSRAITRVLFGFDEVLTIKSDGEIIPVGEARMTRILKDSGAEVPLAVFTDARMEDVSAVIFSNTATWGKLRALHTSPKPDIIFSSTRFAPGQTSPKAEVVSGEYYHETLLDGLHLFINPYAKNKLNIRSFTSREVAIHTFSPESLNYVPWYPEGFLFHRTLIRSSSDEGFNPLPDDDSKHYKKPKRPAWEEGKLRPAEAGTFMFSDNHLAHWRGWTILVAKDVTDGDWITQSTQTLVMSVPEFMRATEELSIAHFVLEGTDLTKESALERAMIKINKKTR